MPGMAIILPALAVAFAAFCVWLTVRIVNRRERWAKWTLAAVVSLPVLYVASYGPACWWFSGVYGPSSSNGSKVRRVPQIYRPIVWTAIAISRADRQFRDAAQLVRVALFMSGDSLECEIDWDGRQIIIPVAN